MDTTGILGDLQSVHYAEQNAAQAGYKNGVKDGKEQVRKEWQEQINWLLECLEEGFINEEKAFDLLLHPQKCNDEMVKAEAMENEPPEEETLCKKPHDGGDNSPEVCGECVAIKWGL